MEVPIAVAVGSAPGDLPGRGVAGCCASGPQVPNDDGSAEAPLPVPARTDRPAGGVGGPQHRPEPGHRVC